MNCGKMVKDASLYHYSAEMNQQAGKVRIVGRDKEKEMLARLSWLLLDAGTSALKNTFDSVHPPASLREHLGQTHVKAILQRLHTQVLGYLK